MKLLKFMVLIAIFILPAISAGAHHYKGLPHYGYFENYPQVPYLEFIKETPEYELFVTVYNFQGLNLEQVESSDDVRLYIFIYDIEADKVFQNEASFEVLSHGKTVYKTGFIPPEQESIYVIQEQIKEQDDLVLNVEFADKNGAPVRLEMPFQITQTFFQKYSLYIFIALFFAVVIMLKIVTSRLQKNKEQAPGKQVGTAGA